jgi:putative transposase
MAPSIDPTPADHALGREITELVVRMARENSDWGYDRIAGALKNLGHSISDQTVGNILRRFGIAPAPKRSQHMNWKDFIRRHMAVMTGIDFFTCSPGAAWSPILCCFLCSWRHAVSPWQA